MNGPFKMKPGQKKQAFKEIPLSMKSPFYVTGDPIEKKVSTEVSKSRVTKPSGQTGTLVTIKDKFKTPGGEVPRTAEGDKAYADKTPEQRKAQDEAYLAKKRSETRQRFIADPMKIKTAGTSKISIDAPKPSASLDAGKIRGTYIDKTLKTENNFDIKKKIASQERDRIIKTNKERIASGDEISRPERVQTSKYLRTLREASYTPEEVTNRKKSTKKKTKKYKSNKGNRSLAAAKIGDFFEGVGDALSGCKTCK